MNLIKNNLIIIMTALLASCSSSHVSNDWDCPKQSGYGCINIERADSIALSKLSTQIDTDLQNDDTKVGLSSKVIQEVWFAPFTDQFGKAQPASIIQYLVGE